MGLSHAWLRKHQAADDRESSVTPDPAGTPTYSPCPTNACLGSSGPASLSDLDHRIETYQLPPWGRTFASSQLF